MPERGTIYRATHRIPELMVEAGEFVHDPEDGRPLMLYRFTKAPLSEDARAKLERHWPRPRKD